MMNDILSQEEIDMLLRGDTSDDTDYALSPEEIDIIGEIGNISMGTAATTLSTLLGKKVTITAPDVQQTTFEELANEYKMPFVAIEVAYTEGIEGKNLLVIKDNDVKIITDLMMGGEGIYVDKELDEMHLSAISEVMNQMVGSSATSLSTMLGKTISISPPSAFVIKFGEDESYSHFREDKTVIIQVKFRMIVEGFIDSYIMQLLPIDFGKDLIQSLMNTGGTEEVEEVSTVESSIDGPSEGSPEARAVEAPEPRAEPRSEPRSEPRAESTPESRSGHSSRQPYIETESVNFTEPTNPVDVRPVSFQPLDEIESVKQPENIDMIMDIPLQITVELGKTKRLIKDVLELNIGSILELDKMAGEPVDILVNGKAIAKGEVVVIEDSFGVRITDIISSSKRLSNLK